MILPTVQPDLDLDPTLDFEPGCDIEWLLDIVTRQKWPLACDRPAVWQVDWAHGCCTGKSVSLRCEEHVRLTQATGEVCCPVCFGLIPVTRMERL